MSWHIFSRAFWPILAGGITAAAATVFFAAALSYVEARTRELDWSHGPRSAVLLMLVMGWAVALRYGPAFAARWVYGWFDVFE